MAEAASLAVLNQISVAIASLKKVRSQLSGSRSAVKEVDLYEQNFYKQYQILQNTLTQIICSATTWPEADVKDYLGDLKNPDHAASRELDQQIRQYLSDDVYRELVVTLWKVDEQLQQAAEFIHKTEGLSENRYRSTWRKLGPLRQGRDAQREAIGRIKEQNDRLQRISDLVKHAPPVGTVEYSVNVPVDIPAGAVIEIGSAIGPVRDLREALLRNIEVAREQATELRDVTSAYESLANDDTASDNTSGYLSDTPTEDDSAAPTLSFLSVTLADALPGKDDLRITELALLDTGATKSCISEEVATALLAEIQPSENRVFWTATRDQEVFHLGRVKLRIRWTDGEGVEHHVKNWFYVVKELIEPVMLSDSFRRSHPEIMDLAEARTVTENHIAAIGIGRLRSRARRDSDEQFLIDQVAVNRQRDQEAAQKRLEELRISMRVMLTPAASSAASLVTTTTDTIATTATQQSTADQTSQGSGGGI